ncbi:MAG: glutamine--fructose-6-phosphate transaminase (isomerizing) [Bacilli bacterium]|nr:glutamine--fructose-6-phosphate transaminase (isomerizing) [Bacilli bacterium]
MCGIVGCIGIKDPRDYVIKGLKTLSYRGYDSAGLAFINHGINIIKDKGNVEHLDDIVPPSFESNLAIGHTRWATHGVASKNNAHPHISNHHLFSLVHNGVIENYVSIKSFLDKQGYIFYSETDSEVIVNLIEYYYLKGDDMLEVLYKVNEKLEGSYALCIIKEDDPDHIYVMRTGSPLLIGVGNNFHLISSDASAMIDYTNQFIELNDGEYGVVSKDRATIYNDRAEEVEKSFISRDAADVSTDLKGYPFYMVKEIEEIPEIADRLINTYYQDGKYTFDEELIKSIKKADHVIFIACGTSYHASLVGGRLFESFYNVSTSEYIASEWANHPRIPGEWPFVILISQSGETADLIRCQKIVQEKGIPSLVITNTLGSTLYRNSPYSLLLHAGKEVSVASTKAYVAQVLVLSMLVGAVSDNEKIISDINKAVKVIPMVQSQRDDFALLANKIKSSHSLYFLGRGYDYLLSLEASLKLKEVSYIHSECFPGGEIKHGPIALIDKNTPVIVFISDEENVSNMRGNIKEVESRGAKTFVISTKNLSVDTDSIVVDDFPYYLTSLVISTAAFYIAYYTAVAKGYNVDRPRNLAKSVTVE